MAELRGAFLEIDARDSAVVDKFFADNFPVKLPVETREELTEILAGRTKLFAENVQLSWNRPPETCETC